MIDDKSELLTLGQAARLLPGRPGKSLHPATVARWALHGVGPQAHRVRLRSAKLGGRRVTTRQWLEDFIARVTRNASPDEQSTDEESIDECTETERRLDEVGL